MCVYPIVIKYKLNGVRNSMFFNENYTALFRPSNSDFLSIQEVTFRSVEIY